MGTLNGPGLSIVTGLQWPPAPTPTHFLAYLVWYLKTKVSYGMGEQ